MELDNEIVLPKPQRGAYIQSLYCKKLDTVSSMTVLVSAADGY